MSFWTYRSMGSAALKSPPQLGRQLREASALDFCTQVTVSSTPESHLSAVYCLYLLGEGLKNFELYVLPGFLEFC